MGAVVYNELPLDIRKIESYREFEEQLKEHFKWNIIGSSEHKHKHKQ